MKKIEELEGVKLFLNTEELIKLNIVNYFPLFPKDIFFLGIKEGIKAPIEIEYQGSNYIQHYANIKAPLDQLDGCVKVRVYEKVIYREKYLNSK